MMKRSNSKFSKNSEIDINELKRLCKEAFVLRAEMPIYENNKNILTKLFKEHDQTNQDYDKKVYIRWDLLTIMYSVRRTFKAAASSKDIENIINFCISLENVIDDSEKEKQFDNIVKFAQNHEQSKLVAAKKTKEKTSSLMPSFVSKYAYFYLKHEFPIFDSLAQQTICKIQKRLPLDYSKQSSQGPVQDFFDYYKKLAEELRLGKKTYDKIDAFLWLYGKFTELKKIQNDDRKQTRLYYTLMYGILEKKHIEWYNKAQQLLDDEPDDHNETNLIRLKRR